MRLKSAISFLVIVVSIIDTIAAEVVFDEPIDTPQSDMLNLAPSAPIVTLYEHYNYGGRYKTFRGNTSWVETDFNDITSSLKIPNDYQITVYEHANYGGRSKSFTASTPWVGEDFNEIISSFVLRKISPYAPTVTLYEL
jgi:hypothetical protein